MNTPEIKLQVTYSFGKLDDSKSCSFQIEISDPENTKSEILLTGKIADIDNDDQTTRFVSLSDVTFTGAVEQLLPAERFPLCCLVYIPTMFYRFGIGDEVSLYLERQVTTPLRTVNSVDEKAWLALELSRRFGAFDPDRNTFSTTDFLRIGKELHTANVTLVPIAK